MPRHLDLWTIYFEPPAGYSARRFEAHPGVAEPVRTDDVKRAGSLTELRSLFDALGLFCMPRKPNDHPFIVETWL